MDGHFKNKDEHYDDIIPLSVKYQDAALMHRITLDGVFNEDWSIYGSIPIDFRQFDQVWKPFIEGKKLPYGLKGARMTTAQIPEYGSTDSEIVAYWADFSAHFKAKGWFDILFDYTFDEPGDYEDYEKIKKRAGLVHQAMPDLRVLVTTDIQEASRFGVLDRSVFFRWQWRWHTLLSRQTGESGRNYTYSYCQHQAKNDSRRHGGL